MHDELFDHQNHLENLLECARHINLETDRFQKEIFAEENRKRVFEDRRSGVRSGVAIPMTCLSMGSDSTKRWKRTTFGGKLNTLI